MKKTIPMFIVLLALFLILQSFVPHKEILKKDGAAPGYTGSPGDSLKNCTSCHGGTAITEADWITSNIPSNGYQPGKTYTITATNKESGATRFGFEVSPQNIKGDLLGKIVVTDSVRTKFVGDGNKYITYTANGIEGVNQMSWTFDWIAPSAGTGDVVFYGGFNSNFEGHKDGDKTYLSTLTVTENKSNTSVNEEQNDKILLFSILPNPSSDFVSINIELNELLNVKLDLIDINGNDIDCLLNQMIIGKFTKEFNLSAIASGNYYLKLIVDNKITIKKLNIIR